MGWRKGVVGEDSSTAVNGAAVNEGVMHLTSCTEASGDKTVG
jgi:hypothetical protein